MTGTANGLNQLTAVGGVSNSHDSRGNVSAIGANSYGYSSENLLTSAPSSTTLSYDPANRLYQSAGGSTTRFGYDGGNLIGEYNSSNALQRRYVFGPGSDEPLVQYEGTGTSTRRWFHADERGSVAAVSDASGDMVTAVNRYDEYGNVQGTLTGRFGYTGQAWLPEIGMAYYRARIYNPAMGRFMQTDPIGYGGGMNLYAYVGNNPVNFTDPLGLQCDDCTITVTGARPGSSGVLIGGGAEGRFFLDAPAESDGGGDGAPGDGSPADPCEARSTPVLRAGPDSIVYKSDLMTAAAASILYHIWPLNADLLSHSTFSENMNPEILADLAGELIATRAAVRGGYIYSRVTGNVGVIVGNNVRSSLPSTTYMTVILGPLMANPKGGLPKRIPIHMFPGC